MTKQEEQITDRKDVRRTLVKFLRRTEAREINPKHWEGQTDTDFYVGIHDPHVFKLEKSGLVSYTGCNCYELTPQGKALATQFSTEFDGEEVEEMTDTEA